MLVFCASAPHFNNLIAIKILAATCIYNLCIPIGLYITYRYFFVSFLLNFLTNSTSSKNIFFNHSNNLCAQH